MRKLTAAERVTLGGVFDAESMDEWWEPYHSDERAAQLVE